MTLSLCLLVTKLILLKKGSHKVHFLLCFFGARAVVVGGLCLRTNEGEIHLLVLLFHLNGHMALSLSFRGMYVGIMER